MLSDLKSTIMIQSMLITTTHNLEHSYYGKFCFVVTSSSLISVGQIDIRFTGIHGTSSIPYCISHIDASGLLNFVFVHNANKAICVAYARKIWQYLIVSEEWKISQWTLHTKPTLPTNSLTVKLHRLNHFKCNRPSQAVCGGKFCWSPLTAWQLLNTHMLFLPLVGFGAILYTQDGEDRHDNYYEKVCA